MPNYDFICDNCGREDEDLYFRISEKLPEKCPSCKKKKYRINISTAPYASVQQDPTTFGQLAERNSKAMGKYGVEDKTRNDKSLYDQRKLNYAKKQGLVSQDATELKPEKTIINPEGKNLSKELKDVISDPKKTKKYIMEGKK